MQYSIYFVQVLITTVIARSKTFQKHSTTTSTICPSNQPHLPIGEFNSTFDMEKIDVHSHAVPPKYRQYLIDYGYQNPDGMPAIPSWNAEDHLKLMKDNNITTSILSISSPGTNLAPGDQEQCVKITRTANEELSAICVAHPKQFKFFASLPLLSQSACLSEIDYAIDTLGAAGFVVLSNTNGVYIGDPSLDPIFKKLNERKAIVFMHPTSTTLIHNGQPLVVNVQPFPRPVMEFMFDETRTVANILLSGTVEKYPNITYIMSHCGCTLPSVVDRVEAFGTVLMNRSEGENFKAALKKNFYFDLAGVPFPNQIHGLLRMLGEGAEKRLVYGSDYPFTAAPLVVKLMNTLDNGSKELLGEEGHNDMFSRNARKLFALRD